MTTRIDKIRWCGSLSIWSFSDRMPAGLLMRKHIPWAGYWLRLCVFAPVRMHADSAAHRVRIKDVATIEGIRENQLVGYGIVVGLERHGR